jgi:hypothetical protein
MLKNKEKRFREVEVRKLRDCKSEERGQKLYL